MNECHSTSGWSKPGEGLTVASAEGAASSKAFGWIPFGVGSNLKEG
jgi:hypothetical protein